MCSIAGSYHYAETEKMLLMMKHRAPDGMSIIEQEGFYIGMGRLAIIDLKSTGLSPYEEDGFVLSFNGEIYNYIELREELGKLGWDFRTGSDIEVCLKAYRQWGPDCLQKFNGMFAFTVIHNEMIFLARDIAGEKPLYYDLDRDHNFSFASEAKALGLSCLELPPAHYATYQLNSSNGLEFHKYWEPEKIEISDPERELEVLLEDAVKIRTQSDVPYGLYLSGGVDSTLISTFHNFEHTFTYQDKDYQEEFLEKFPKILWHLDYPISSFSAFGLYKLAEEASKKVKVVLSGEGADELFGGYVRYIQPHFNSLAQKKFPSYRSMFQPAKNVQQSGLEEFNGNLRELLRMGDRMASAFSIENRCPFLDKRIINFAFSLPEEYKINGLNTKVILNRILKKRKPDYKEIEKQGMYCSVNNWLGESDPLDKKMYTTYQHEIIGRNSNV